MSQPLPLKPLRPTVARPSTAAGTPPNSWRNVTIQPSEPFMGVSACNLRFETESRRKSALFAASQFLAAAAAVSPDAVPSLPFLTVGLLSDRGVPNSFHETLTPDPMSDTI